MFSSRMNGIGGMFEVFLVLRSLVLLFQFEDNYQSKFLRIFFFNELGSKGRRKVIFIYLVV